MQPYPESPAAEHEGKHGGDQKQGNPLSIDPGVCLALVVGAHYKIQPDPAGSCLGPRILGLSRKQIITQSTAYCPLVQHDKRTDNLISALGVLTLGEIEALAAQLVAEAR